jgi:hypothetical protein
MSSLLEAVLFSRLGLVYILIGARDRQRGRYFTAHYLPFPPKPLVTYCELRLLWDRYNARSEE